MSISLFKAPSEMHPAARNPRKHSKKQLNDLAASIKAYGFNAPVIISAADEIICGEARWLAAQILQLAIIPVMVIDHLTAQQIEAYRIADNKIALSASWDDDLLAAVMSDLQEQGQDLTATGFSDSELVRLLASLDKTISQDTDALTDVLPHHPTIASMGDVWALGEHRLICGDSTRPETYAALLAGEKVDTVITDPPYGMSYGGGRTAGSSAKGSRVKAHGMILNDDAQGDELVGLVSGALSQARKNALEGAAFYVCLTWRTYGEFLNALHASGLNLAACIVWDKQYIGLGMQHYRPQHEFIFYAKGREFFGGKNESDVWSIGRDATTDYQHPTQKPTAVFERMIANSTQRGQIVLDCFGGSGSSLLAAEKLGRKARLIELDPKYCDVIINRWKIKTGGIPQKI